MVWYNFDSDINYVKASGKLPRIPNKCKYKLGENNFLVIFYFAMSGETLIIF